MIYLGVDGGQSSTTALIGDHQGRVIGMGRGGPCNHVGAAEGRAKFIHAIESSVEAACAQAAVHPRFESACLGFSGGPADKEAILREILPAARLLVTHDAWIALSGATAGEPGIIVIAGTGSMAFGRNARGATARAGGWGYIFGDEGSGFDLARQALRAVLRAEEGWGPPTLLRELLLRETGASDANDLLHRFYTTEFPRPRIAALSKLVDEAARRGDELSHGLLTASARALVSLGLAIRTQLFPPRDDVHVAYIGGVFRSDTIRQYFDAGLAADLRATVQAPIYGPAAGALIEAYRAAGMYPVLSQVPEIEK